MDLKARLRALEAASGRRRQPAAAFASPCDAGPQGRPVPDAGLVQGATIVQAAGGATDGEQALARRLDADIVAAGLLHRCLDLPADHRHGGVPLADVLAVGQDPLGVEVPPAREGWLFLDTETTGLAGGTGTLVFLFGGVHVTSHGFRLHQWLLSRFSGECALLAAMQDLLDRCALVVSYNGKSFDLPLLRTRMRLQGRQLRESHLVHLDLLHPARSAFARHWPDVRLQTAERRLCAFERHDDLPGSQAPLAFASWLRRGDADGLARVMQHHRDDVLSLVTLCAALSRAYRDPLASGADAAGIVRRLRRRGYGVREGQACLFTS